MYANEWLKTVEQFFREKNRAWLTDEETLLHFLAGTPADCHSWQEVRALREASRRRHARYRKAKTNLQILSASWHKNKEHAVVNALETVRFYYEQNDQLLHETRRVNHRLILMPFGSTWRLVQDVTDREDSRPWHREEVQPAADALASMDEAMRQPMMRRRYDRIRAYRYAELWWDSFNPAFKVMTGNDCTNYISQVLYAGGISMVPSASRGNGWWYRANGTHHNWSFSWAVAHSLRLSLTRHMHAREVGDPRQLKVGDIICYDWDGDGRWQHNTVVVDFDAYGMPLVNAHTIASHRRYWDYRDSYAYSPRTRYSYFQMPDEP